MKRQEHNQYILHDDCAECFCYNLRNEFVCSFFIDIEDLEKCKLHRWFVKYGKGNYRNIVTDINNQRVALHRYLLDYYGKNQIDHIDRNPLNNRKNNLRVVTVVENNANKNGKNIQKYPNGKYKCLFVRYGKTFYLGYYNTEEEAQEAKKKKIEEIEKNKEYYLNEYKKLTKEKSKGVSYTPSGKWRAGVTKNGKQIKIGLFDTASEAKAAREQYLFRLSQEGL